MDIPIRCDACGKEIPRDGGLIIEGKVYCHRISQNSTCATRQISTHRFEKRTREMEEGAVEFLESRGFIIQDDDDGDWTNWDYQLILSSGFKIWLTIGLYKGDEQKKGWDFSATLWEPKGSGGEGYISLIDWSEEKRTNKVGDAYTGAWSMIHHLMMMFSDLSGQKLSEG